MNGSAALRAGHFADPAEEEPEVVVDLGNRTYRGAGVGGDGLLLHRKGGGEALDGLNLCPLHLVDKLPGVEGEGGKVATLPLGIEGIEGEGTLPGAGDTGYHREESPGDIEVNPLQVVLSGLTDLDVLHGALSEEGGQ